MVPHVAFSGGHPVHFHSLATFPGIVQPSGGSFARPLGSPPRQSIRNCFGAFGFALPLGTSSAYHWLWASSPHTNDRNGEPSAGANCPGRSPRLLLPPSPSAIFPQPSRPRSTVAKLEVVRRRSAHAMKKASLLWNLTRGLLILFCGYQLLFASLDALRAERMLSMAQLPCEHHEAIRTIPMPETIQSVRQVLRRHSPSSLSYAGLLVILALSPYAKTRNHQPLSSLSSMAGVTCFRGTISLP